jgi:hypothetical protein
MSDIDNLAHHEHGSGRHNGGPPLDDVMADYVDRPGLAALWHITPKTLQRYEAEPDGLPSLKLGGRVYYRLSSAMAWLAARERRPNARRAA